MFAECLLAFVVKCHQCILHSGTIVHTRWIISLFDFVLKSIYFVFILFFGMKMYCFIFQAVVDCVHWPFSKCFAKALRFSCDAKIILHFFPKTAFQ